jgi:DNA processing protein
MLENQRRLLLLCALRDSAGGRIDWHLLARTAQTVEDLDGWFNGQIRERSAKAAKARRILAGALHDPAARRAADEHVDRQIEAAGGVDAQLTTVLDTDYPANLRLVPDAPPFLFYRGHLAPGDARSIAVVGTRQASADGVSRAARMARGLSAAGIVVVSGLAKGIDTAAHTAVVDLNARTVAVTGTGIAAPTYPRENSQLAHRIVQAGGAVLSQFWPTDPPDRWRFPARNITMSGFTQGTVVIEASSTSGAKMQAQAAYKHGKMVFLLRSLAATQPWARQMLTDALGLDVDDCGAPADRPTRATPVVVVSDVADVISRVAPADAVTAAAKQRHRLAQATL